jgi:hypothetical protein
MNFAGAPAPQPDLQARQARAEARYARACSTVQRTQRLIEWSRTMTRYRRGRIRGGSERAFIGDSQRDLIAVRVRDLIAAGILPRKRPTKMFVGPTMDSHACIMCGEKLTRGEIEYEFDMNSHVIHLHHRCCQLWHELESESA